MKTEPYRKLEIEWAEFNGVPPEHCAVCSSGTAALHLAFECLRLPLGSGVIVPDYTMISCARAVSLAGLTVQVCDVSEDNALIDPKSLEESIKEHTKAVLLVHLYGRRVPDSVYEVARKHKLRIVEDCAQFHGAPLSGKADAYCWSFYKNKIVSGEEGGAVIFANSDHARLARSLRTVGMEFDGHGIPTYWHVPRGHNYRLSNVHAELILRSLQRVRVELNRRAHVAAKIAEEYELPLLSQHREVTWVADFVLSDCAEALSRFESLRRSGWRVRPGYVPISRQWEYAGRRTGRIADSLARRMLYVDLSV